MHFAYYVILNLVPMQLGGESADNNSDVEDTWNFKEGFSSSEGHLMKGQGCSCERASLESAWAFCPAAASVWKRMRCCASRNLKWHTGLAESRVCAQRGREKGTCTHSCTPDLKSFVQMKTCPRSMFALVKKLSHSNTIFLSIPQGNAQYRIIRE